MQIGHQTPMTEGPHQDTVPILETMLCHGVQRSNLQFQDPT